MASQVREARRQAEMHVDWYAELKHNLRRAERVRAERDLAKAEAGVARLRDLLARRPTAGGPRRGGREDLVVSARVPRGHGVAGVEGNEPFQVAALGAARSVAQIRAGVAGATGASGGRSR